MAKLKLNTISLQQFGVDAPHKLITAEASSIGFDKLLSRVFDDACDVGFQVESQHTGKVVTFVMDSTESSADDVICWYLKPMQATDTNYTMVIFND